MKNEKQWVVINDEGVITGWYDTYEEAEKATCYVAGFSRVEKLEN